MPIAVDPLQIHSVFHISPPLNTYLNRWKISLPVNRMTVKNEAIHSISYKLHQCMPHSIPVQPIQYILLLIFCSLSNAFLKFPPNAMVNIIFRSKLIFIHSHTKTSGVQCECVLFFTFLARISGRVHSQVPKI